MPDIPTFKLFGENDTDVQARLRPDIGYRNWSDLHPDEKKIALRELIHRNVINHNRDFILETIEYLNRKFLNRCPGKNLHNTPRYDDYGLYNSVVLEHAARKDFEDIFSGEKLDEMVMLMLSKFVKCFINENELEMARVEIDLEKREELIQSAFKRFDWVSNHFNHIFEQFSINQEVTRGGFVPRQSKKISEFIYQPTLDILSDPKWQSVDSDFAKMFDDFQNAKYSESIAKAHNSVQRFLQVLIGKEGKNGKGNFGQLFSEAKKNGLISDNLFTGPVINAMQSYIASERANNSTAKPTVKEATYSDALLMMNVVMVLIQHCLQNLNDGTNSE